MTQLNEVLGKIPKPLLVGGVLVLALIIIIYSNPLHNGCDVQVSNFNNQVAGYLINTKTKSKKTKLAEVNTGKNFCKDGNSQGACENYFAALAKISEAFITFDDKCFERLSEDEKLANLEPQLKEALKVLALLAWGEKPPGGLAERAGWLSKTEIYTFCRLKTALINLIGDENFKNYRYSVLKEYPDVWPEQLKNQAVSGEIQRPTVLKWSGNPQGTLNENEVLQRSLFSLRCEQYQ